MRRRALELGFAAFAAVNVAAMVRWARWETVPFHFVWISLTLVYGLHVWRLRPTVAVLAAIAVGTGVPLWSDAAHGTQPWGELTEVPLMAAVFVAMMWHARRHQRALGTVERLADERASLLERQTRFVQDASHELRTPVTIARGHLEVLRRGTGERPEIDVALDELQRMERIIDRLLLLADVDRTDFLRVEAIEADVFLEDVFLRWSDAAPRAWRLGDVAQGRLVGDPEAIRIALDALLENAVKYTSPHATVELGSRADGDTLAIEVRDEGIGIPAESVNSIFERFARVDAARGRGEGGFGLGLAIADAIAKAHGGRCTVHSSAGGSTFALVLPGFEPGQNAARADPAAAGVPTFA